MLNFLTKEPMKIITVGDMYVSNDAMEEAIRKSKINVGEIIKLNWGATTTDEWAIHQLNIERNGSEAEPYPSELDDLIADADVLMVQFSPIPKKLIEKARNLKAILTCRGGLEHINVKTASERNIPVINVIRNAVPVAEFAIGLMIDITRNISQMHCNIVNGSWPKVFPNTEFMSTIANLTVGLVGMGNIGIEMAIRLKSFGTKIIAFDKYIDKERIAKNDLVDCVEFKDKVEDVFKEADIVSLHMRLVPETEKMVDKRLLSLMRKSSYFINTARGGLVNQEDLIDALYNNRIAGAALDVYDVEPIPSDSKLLKLKNVTLTSHMAGTTVDAVAKCPLLLMKEVDKIIDKDITDRIVNYKDITL